MRTTPSPSLYLTAGRLSDVLALIQVLAYGELAKRTHASLEAQLRRSPVTTDTWTELGRQHPELFRVLEAERHQSQQETVALIARFLNPGLEAGADKPPKSCPLSPDETSKLMELAIQLHDREVQRREWWKSILVPIAVALISVAGTLAGVLIGASSKSAGPSTNAQSSTKAGQERGWQGFATNRSSGRVETWLVWRGSRDACLKDMNFDVANSVQAQWYRAPTGCFYVGSDNKLVLYWVNRFYNSNVLECIAAVKEPGAGNRYVALPKGLPRVTEAWTCE